MGLLEAILGSNTWFGTKVAEQFPIANRASMPERILQDGLESVGYEGSVARFAYERVFRKGWVGFHFAEKLLTYTFSRVSSAVDSHKGLIVPQLLIDNGRVLKDTLHTFCYHPDIYCPKDRIPREHLTIKVGSFQLLRLIHGVTMEPGIIKVDIEKEEDIGKVVEEMIRTGLIGIKPQKRIQDLYLTRQADAFLEVPSIVNTSE